MEVENAHGIRRNSARIKDEKQDKTAFSIALLMVLSLFLVPFFADLRRVFVIR